MNLCIIPARGGSKRIPGKNIRDFCGKPMIAYAIEAARSSNIFSKIIVSTDSSQIAEVARSCGASTPFSRPANLSDDYTPTISVIRHAISEAERAGELFDKVCCLYPTVPLIQPGDIASGLEVLNDEDGVYSFPVAEFPSTIYRALNLADNRRLKPIYPENQLKRSQDFKKAYFDAGQFYCAHKNTWRSVAEIHDNGIGLVIPKWRVVDIDTLEDWKLAESLYCVQNKK
jgi:pseudaminic acid cytidylyltransferase